MSIHETQETAHVEAYTGVLPHLEAAQRIEGGAPPQKVILRNLPAPVRFFGYFFMAVMLVMLVFTVVAILGWV